MVWMNRNTMINVILTKMRDDKNLQIESSANRQHLFVDSSHFYLLENSLNIIFIYIQQIIITIINLNSTNHLKSVCVHSSSGKVDFFRAYFSTIQFLQISNQWRHIPWKELWTVQVRWYWAPWVINEYWSVLPGLDVAFKLFPIFGKEEQTERRYKGEHLVMVDGSDSLQFLIESPLKPPSHPSPPRRPWQSSSSADRIQPRARKASSYRWHSWSRWMSWCRCIGRTVATHSLGNWSPWLDICHSSLGYYLVVVENKKPGGLDLSASANKFYLFKTEQHSTQTRQLLCFGANRNGFSLMLVNGHEWWWWWWNCGAWRWRWWQDDLSTIVPSGKSTAAVTNLFLYQLSIIFHCFSLLLIVNVQQIKIPFSTIWVLPSRTIALRAMNLHLIKIPHFCNSEEDRNAKLKIKVTTHFHFTRIWNNHYLLITH